MSRLAARIVAKRGYTNVAWFKGGIPEWVAAGYKLARGKALPKYEVPSLNAREFHRRRGEFLVVDIRTEKLRRMGWIEGSLWIPLAMLSERFGEIPCQQKVMLVDHAGRQVVLAGRFLIHHGFKDVYRLQGGVISWISQGYPVRRR